MTKDKESRDLRLFHISLYSNNTPDSSVAINVTGLDESELGGGGSEALLLLLPPLLVLESLPFLAYQPISHSFLVADRPVFHILVFRCRCNFPRGDTGNILIYTNKRVL